MTQATTTTSATSPTLGTPSAHVRGIRELATAHRQTEGAGFIVRRPVPSGRRLQVDPFLLIDELGPIDYRPGEAKGAPDHPHRGFETVSYILEGELEHEDSAGHRGYLGAGDVQWMTAGAGIVHSEMPSRRMQTEGGRVHGFQIWVNLPARLKLTRPRYQEVPAARIPKSETPDGLARVKVVAGSALGATAVIDTHVPIAFHDWTIEPGADVTFALAPELATLVYVFDGAVAIGDDAQRVVSGQLAILDDGDAVRLRGVDGATEAGRLLVLAGTPLHEPLARYGPFVMNTEREIREAIADFQSGKMGEITRSAEVVTGR